MEQPIVVEQLGGGGGPRVEQPGGCRRTPESQVVEDRLTRMMEEGR